MSAEDTDADEIQEYCTKRSFTCKYSFHFDFEIGKSSFHLIKRYSHRNRARSTRQDRKYDYAGICTCDSCVASMR